MSDKKYNRKVGHKRRKKKPIGLWIAVIVAFAALAGAVYLALNLEPEEPKAPEVVVTEPETTAPTQPETTAPTEAPTVPVETRPARKITEKTVTPVYRYALTVQPQQKASGSAVSQTVTTVPAPTTPQSVAPSQTVPAETQPGATEPWTPAPSETCAHTTLIGAGQECFEHFAKCTTPGNGVYVCASCHEVIEKPEPDRYPAKGHDPVVEQDGSSWCYRCGAVLSGPTVTDPPAAEPQPMIPPIVDIPSTEPQETLPVVELPSELPPVEETPIDE